jgi:hypothetical protein
MEQALIEKLKSQIVTDFDSKIEALKKEKNAKLDALSILEPNLLSLQAGMEEISLGDNLIKMPKKIKTAPIFKKKQIHTKRNGPSIKEIIKSVLNDMPEKFLRNDLFNRVKEKAGERPITNGNFSPEFSKLLKENIIVKISDSSGNQPGLYGKGSEGRD